MSVEYYEEINQLLEKARQALTDREKEVSRVCDIIESDMDLLGATGVEDQLQDGVPETLESLRAAGIKVLVPESSFLSEFDYDYNVGVGLNW